MFARAIAVPAVLLAAIVPCGGIRAQSMPPEVQVGARTISDYEFDWGRDGTDCQACNFGAGNNRLAFIDDDGSVWTSHVNINNGYFGSTDGRGARVDTNAIPAGVTGNGPEWISLTQGSGLVYDRYLDGMPHTSGNGCIGMAHVGAGRQWYGDCMSGSQGYALPIGSAVMHDRFPLVSYQNFSRTITNVYWRLAKDGSEAHEVLSGSTQTGVTRRWVDGTHKLVLTAPAAPDTQGDVYRQVFLYSADDDTMEQLTFDPTNKTSAFMWKAPEYGNRYVFFARVSVTEIDIYRLRQNLETGKSEWQVVNRIHSAQDYPYFYSAEPFVYKGKSWLIFSVASEQQGHQIKGTSQIAMSGIESGVDSFRVLTSDATAARARRDPEYYITAQGPYIYYNRYIVSAPGVAEPEGVFRVDSGLGPQ